MTVVRFAGGPMHGERVPKDKLDAKQLEVILQSGLVFHYQRGLWYEFEGVGDGETFYGLMGAEWDDVMKWAREVLRPC